MPDFLPLINTGVLCDAIIPAHIVLCEDAIHHATAVATERFVIEYYGAVITIFTAMVAGGFYFNHVHFPI